MKKKRFLIVGGGGRESSFASRLIEDSAVYAVISHRNPGIVECVAESGGEYLVGDVNDPAVVCRFAREHAIDYAFVNADACLANGVVDELLEHDIKAIGGTRAASRIEWDKVYSIGVMQAVCPEFTPYHRVVSGPQELQDAIADFRQRNLPVVVKPQGLTGGKGVKVMPIHLETYDHCIEYANELLAGRPEEQVLLVEKLEGIEFTVMGITDGRNLVMAPASYDYPFRLEDDLGPGTGGMGCFTAGENRLPFMDEGDWQQCEIIMSRVIERMAAEQLGFNGVLNGGFFKTRQGIRFMEFNGRFGDPEGLNILMLLKGSFSAVLEDIWHQRLAAGNLEFSTQASVIKYLVAQEYPEASAEAIDFAVDERGIEDMGAQLLYASCENTGAGQYRTLRKSRVLAVGALADEIEDAAELVNRAIRQHVAGPLEFRPDIGSRQNLEKLRRQAAGLAP